MFTLSKARAAIGNASQFARGSAYVQEGCVRNVTLREDAAGLIYEGEIQAGKQVFRASFEYHPGADEIGATCCSCEEHARLRQGCRHAAALMIAVCGGAGEPVGPREGGEFMAGLLDQQRERPRMRLPAQ